MREKDLEYNKIVKDILDNSEYQKLGNISHHGGTRLAHSMRVSYYSYRITRFLHLNYVDTARAGLLHDFFLTQPSEHTSGRTKMFVSHPRIAYMNAKGLFEINDIEEDIIKTHMFPATVFAAPKYLESWIVSCVDKYCAICELSHTLKYTYRFHRDMYSILFYNRFR